MNEPLHREDAAPPLARRKYAGSCYTGEPVARMPPGQREPAWACRCTREDGRPLLRSRRHREPWQCLTAANVAAWRAAHPEASCGEQPARGLTWLAQEFSAREERQ